MAHKPTVLVVEDDPDGCRSVTEALEDMDCRVVAVLSGEEGVRAFQTGNVDVVLTDLVLPDIDGMDVMKRVKAHNAEIPIIMMTAYGTVSSAVEAMRTGAFDYITKPLDLDELQTRIRRAIENGRLKSEVRNLEATARARHGLESMVADSPAMRELTEQILALAGTTATVLVQGESGTGKELVARALHTESARSRGPFIAVNCGAFTESLLESELFGHEKGAFTGAFERRKGAFERADGGTLFLDEVGTAPASVQVKLLRVLEERELFRVGGQNAISVDVRVVSASNADLATLVEAGEFREDLLYRLNVVTLELPPLRDRREDIPAMADRFVRAACGQHGIEAKELAPECYALLAAQDWPGNVRQLRNVIEAAVVMTPERVLLPRHMRLENAAGRRQENSGFVPPEGMSLEEMEKEILSRMLERHAGNRTLVADKLGISRRTIQRKIKEYELPF